MPPRRIEPEQRLDVTLTPQERDLTFTDKEALPGVAAEEARPFTVKQGQYLAFIYYHTKIHGTPPAESDFQRFFRVTPPARHQMIRTLQEHGFIERRGKGFHSRLVACGSNRWL